MSRVFENSGKKLITNHSVNIKILEYKSKTNEREIKVYTNYMINRVFYLGYRVNVGRGGAEGKKRKPVLRGIPNTEGWKQDDKEGNKT